MTAPAGMTQANVKVQTEDWKAAKMSALTQRITVEVWVQQAIREKLDREKLDREKESSSK